jgi:hypothetical protein
MDKAMENTVNQHNIMIAKKIDAAMKDQKMSQATLIARMSELGVNVAPGTISKIRNFEEKLDKEKSDLELGIKSPKVYSGFEPRAIHISAICQVLKLDMNHILSFESSSQPVISQELSKPGEVDRSADMISNPKDSAFLGYIDHTFDFFFLATVTKQRELISGTMTLSGKNQSCEVKIVISNTEENQAKFYKEYTGRMVISKQQNACYCTVGNASLSEICSFVFYYRRFHEKDSFKVRLGVATTVSAGDEHRPTCHRVILCKQGVVKSEKQKQFIQSQLRMNRADIIISEKKFNEIATQQNVANVLEIIRSDLALQKNADLYYVINDSNILNLLDMYPNINKMNLLDALALLRTNSIAHRYNKIGKKVDSLLYEYLF